MIILTWGYYLLKYCKKKKLLDLRAFQHHYDLSNL